TSQRTGSEVGVVDTSTDGSSSETIWADRIMIGTDWFMTEMHDITASGFWSWVDDVVNTDHPLWERWASRNAVDYLNLKDRIENLEKLYGDNSVPAKKRPEWWGALKAYYA